MVEGSDELDASSCKAMKALSGFNPNQHLILVRNPDYDQATDEWRKNYIDRFELTLNTNAEDIFNRIKNNTLEGEIAGVPPEVAREYTQNEDLSDKYKVESGDRTWYDLEPDASVRRHPRAEGRQLDHGQGGPPQSLGRAVQGRHLAPHRPRRHVQQRPRGLPAVQERGRRRRLGKGEEEMRQSKYDSNQDGICDAPECEDVLHVTRNTDIWVNMEPVIEQSLAKIGIKIVTREFEDSYTVIQTVKRHVPVSSTPGWGKDYADASTFMVLSTVAASCRRAT